METMIKVNDLSSFKSFIRWNYPGGYSELSIKSGITIGKINSVIKEKSRNKKTILALCNFLLIDHREIKEWKYL